VRPRQSAIDLLPALQLDPTDEALDQP